MTECLISLLSLLTWAVCGLASVPLARHNSRKQYGYDIYFSSPPSWLWLIPLFMMAGPLALLVTWAVTHHD